MFHFSFLWFSFILKIQQLIWNLLNTFHSSFFQPRKIKQQNYTFPMFHASPPIHATHSFMRPESNIFLILLFHVISNKKLPLFIFHIIRRVVEFHAKMKVDIFSTFRIQIPLKKTPKFNFGHNNFLPPPPF